MKNYIFLIASIVILIVPISGKADSKQERIIAGVYLAKLWDAINVDHVNIENPELKSQILDHALSAILIPKEQKTGNYVIRRCFEKRTVFDSPDLNISKYDYDELMLYATDKVFEIIDELSSLANEVDGQKYQIAINKLNEYISKTSIKKVASAERFIGALLSDSESTSLEQLAYIGKFRKYTEQTVIKKLKEPKFANTLKAGEPYFWGSEQYTHSDLGRINPAHVKQIKAGSKEFRAVWVGPTFIIVPQLGWQVPWKDPTGLAISKKWVGAPMNKVVVNLPKLEGEGG